MKPVDGTDLVVYPLCLGSHAFGGSATAEESWQVLDAYEAAGGNFIDTADVYAGGASETIIGDWLARRGNRDRMVLATKLGWTTGLSAAAIHKQIDISLQRLQTDHVDLYFAHRDDDSVPLEETLGAFDDLVKAGKVRYVAASNYGAARLAEAVAISTERGLARYVAIEPLYNLMERASFEAELANVCRNSGLVCFPYRGLAQGFLTGIHRPGAQKVDSPMADDARGYLNDRGVRVLAALDEIAAQNHTTVSAVALAWLAAQPLVAVPIAGARSVDQLADLLPMASLSLSSQELDQLSDASS